MSTVKYQMSNVRGQMSNVNAGFTLVELMIALAIFLVIAASATAIYTKLHTSSGINAAKAELVQALRRTRERSVAGLDNMTYGVHTTATGYTLYRSSASPFLYDGTRDVPYDQTTTLESPTTLSPALTDITFTKGSGTTAAAVTLTLTHGTGETKTIMVNRHGSIE